jgi:hypothetical protein
MNGFKNLRLRSKLLTSFSILIFLSIAVGIVGAVCMSRIEARGEAMYTENTVAMGHLATMYDTLSSQRICISNMATFRVSDPAFAAAEALRRAEMNPAVIGYSDTSIKTT